MSRTAFYAFPEWFGHFCHGGGQPAALVHSGIVSDRSDGKIAHLDGLNLSRAWCWRGLAPLLPPNRAHVARETAAEHLAAAMPHLAGDYMGEHWLASFALALMRLG